MVNPRKTCPVCKAPVKNFIMLCDRTPSGRAVEDEDWLPPETDDLLMEVSEDILYGCREEEETNIDICPRCETAFS